MKDALVKGSYAADVAFFRDQNIEIIELVDRHSEAAVLITPGYQGRVMTSTSGGSTGLSYGWINYSFIESGIRNRQFNPYGGEERLWLGPEGGPFSIYFGQDVEQEYANWQVPPALDTESFDVVAQNQERVSFRKEFELINAAGSALQVQIDRSVKILNRDESEQLLGFKLDKRLSMVAYETDNVLTNAGENMWTKETGVLSIWLLSMFNTSEKSVVFIPFQPGDENELGKVVSDDYFGKVPEDRLMVREGMIFFKTDGKKRSKIGLSPRRALQMCGSYDSDNQLLTLLWYSIPEGPAAYVNSMWRAQDDPFNGDVVNSYNDGPLEDGSLMGPFYEIESSSPAAFLDAGQEIRHTQRIFHIEGDENSLNGITQLLFGITVGEIRSAF